MIIQSELLQCGDLNDLVLNESYLELELNQKSDLNCKGGINSNLSMLIVESSEFFYPSKYDIIAGRKSGRFAMQIIAKRVLNSTWLLFECKPIQANKRSQIVIGRDSILDTITFTSSDTLKYDFPDSYGFIEITPTITPSIYFSLDYDLSSSNGFLVKYFGLKCQFDANILIKSQLNLQKNTLKLLKVPLLKDKTLKKSVFIKN